MTGEITINFNEIKNSFESIYQAINQKFTDTDKFPSQNKPLAATTELYQLYHILEPENDLLLFYHIAQIYLNEEHSTLGHQLARQWAQNNSGKLPRLSQDMSFEQMVIALNQTPGIALVAQLVNNDRESKYPEKKSSRLFCFYHALIEEIDAKLVKNSGIIKTDFENAIQSATQNLHVKPQTATVFRIPAELPALSNVNNINGKKGASSPAADTANLKKIVKKKQQLHNQSFTTAQKVIPIVTIIVSVLALVGLSVGAVYLAPVLVGMALWAQITIGISMGLVGATALGCIAGFSHQIHQRRTSFPAILTIENVLLTEGSALPSTGKHSDLDGDKKPKHDGGTTVNATITSSSSTSVSVSSGADRDTQVGDGASRVTDGSNGTLSTGSTVTTGSVLGGQSTSPQCTEFSDSGSSALDEYDRAESSHTHSGDPTTDPHINPTGTMHAADSNSYASHTDTAVDYDWDGDGLTTTGQTNVPASDAGFLGGATGSYPPTAAAAQPTGYYSHTAASQPPGASSNASDILSVLYTRQTTQQGGGAADGGFGSFDPAQAANFTRGWQ